VFIGVFMEYFLEEITTSFNERKLKTQFYLSRRNGSLE